MIIAKTDANLSAEEYQKWHDLYKNMIDIPQFLTVFISILFQTYIK